MKVVILGYEPTQAGIIGQTYSRLKDEGREVVVVTFDQELEWLLAEVGVTFKSSLMYRRGERLRNLEFTEELVTNVRNLVLSKMSHRGVSMDHLFCFSLHIYLEKWLYFGEVVDQILSVEKPEMIYICEPYFSPPIEKDTALYYENEALVLCAREMCAEQDVICEKIGQPVMTSIVKNDSINSHILKIGLGIANLFFGFIQRKNGIRVLASEYWKHIGPLFDRLPRSSLVLYDRQESKNIPLKTIFRNRIRFMHGPGRLSIDTVTRAREAEKRISDDWKNCRGEILSANFRYGRYDMSKVVVSALDAIIKYQMQENLMEIERIYSLIYRVKPDLVILRASVSAQPHFPILALVAKELGIPSIELQHGLEIFAPGSVSRFHTAGYLALYGKIIQGEMERCVPERPELLVVGSPHFDSLYSTIDSVQADQGEELVCIAPDVSLPAVYDSYDAYEYFRAVANATSSSSISVRIKLRGPRRQPFYHAALKKAFGDGRYKISQGGSVLDACRHAKVAVSCYSTAALELLICGIPTILATVSPLENHFVSFHFGPYEKERAVRIARSAEELSLVLQELSSEKVLRELKERATSFLSQNYAFDGRSVPRLIELIQRVIKKGLSEKKI